MSHSTPIKPTHKAITEYYVALQSIAAQNVSHEMAVRRAFREVLVAAAVDAHPAHPHRTPLPHHFQCRGYLT